MGSLEVLQVRLEYGRWRWGRARFVDWAAYFTVYAYVFMRNGELFDLGRVNYQVFVGNGVGGGDPERCTCGGRAYRRRQTLEVINKR